MKQPITIKTATLQANIFAENEEFNAQLGFHPSTELCAVLSSCPDDNYDVVSDERFDNLEWLFETDKSGNDRYVGFDIINFDGPEDVDKFKNHIVEKLGLPIDEVAYVLNCAVNY